MKAKKIRKLKKEKVYTLTQKEYNNLIDEGKKKGIELTKKYIAFCMAYYINSTGNLESICDLATDIATFVKGDKNYIPNRHCLSFKEWQEKEK